jgi:hypothetical protein
MWYLHMWTNIGIYTMTLWFYSNALSANTTVCPCMYPMLATHVLPVHCLLFNELLGPHMYINTMTLFYWIISIRQKLPANTIVSGPHMWTNRNYISLQKSATYTYLQIIFVVLNSFKLFLCTTESPFAWVP